MKKTRSGWRMKQFEFTAWQYWWMKDLISDPHSYLQLHCMHSIITLTIMNGVLLQRQVHGLSNTTCTPSRKTVPLRPREEILLEIAWDRPTGTWLPRDSYGVYVAPGQACTQGVLGGGGGGQTPPSGSIFFSCQRGLDEDTPTSIVPGKTPSPLSEFSGLALRYGLETHLPWRKKTIMCTLLCQVHPVTSIDHVHPVITT